MTAIQWTDEVWNPVSGCTKVSEGCRHCYAETMARRFWGQRRFGDVDIHPERLDKPLRWRKRRRVFVNSMSDLFHEDVPDAFIDRVFGVMALSQYVGRCRRPGCDHEGGCHEGYVDPPTQHQFQLLTKRPERMREYLAHPERTERVEWGAEQEWSFFAGALESMEWPLPNVWLGVSVEDQDTAGARIPTLLDTPAAVRFVSAEPLLGPIGLERWLRPTSGYHLALSVSGALLGEDFDHLTDGAGNELPKAKAKQLLEQLHAEGVKVIPMQGCSDFDPQKGCRGHKRPGLDWVIVGGESGHQARPCDVEWIRRLVKQCQAAEVPCFVKQLGTLSTHAAEVMAFTGKNEAHGDHRNNFSDRKGGDIDEWPADLRVRQWPQVQA